MCSGDSFASSLAASSIISKADGFSLILNYYWPVPKWFGDVIPDIGAGVLSRIGSISRVMSPDMRECLLSCAGFGSKGRL